jgi:phosphoserine phosphatase
MAAGLLAGYAGATIEEFQPVVRSFLPSARHPTFGRCSVECVYQPMVALPRYLNVNGFRCYIASGGGREFMRVVSQELYGIPAHTVIGSSVALEYREDGGVGQLMHTDQADVFDDGPAKPMRIWSRTGRRPILAAGNANGDLPMLQFSSGLGSALRLLVLHDDAEREFDYVAGAEDVLDRARQQAWTIVSMTNDWANGVHRRRKLTSGDA